MRKIVIAVVALLVVGVSFAASLWVMDTFWPSGSKMQKPVLAELPALPPAARPSLVIAPVAIALSAIRVALDNAAPRDFVGKNNNPVTQLLGKAEIGLTVGRGPIAIAGQPEALTATVPINGSIQITGEIGNQAGRALGGVGGAIGGLLGGNVGRQVEQFATRALNQKTDINGAVVVHSRPALTTNWRLEPNLAAQMNFGNTNLAIAGLRINLSNEIRPLLDPVVTKQVNALQAKIRNDPMIETAARREWAKMCRSVPLGGGNTGLPELWLELKPVKAFAAQPVIDANALTLTIGVQSEARVGPKETKPNCPFPAQLELVPPIRQGRLAIGVPMDIPFTEVNKLIEAQLKGQTFPNDPNASVQVEVRKAALAASGERLLISLLVKAKERKSWFGFGAEATVHVWGKPVIDQKQQILRFTDLSLAVESEAAFGLLGAAARAAVPYLEESLKENAVVDLKPFLADARNKIGATLADFRQVTPGVTVDAAVSELRLVDIAYDSKTLRIITESQGTAKVTVTQLPK
ncbi:MAG: DUF4403 family protein [Pseudolabrys sp.]